MASSSGMTMFAPAERADLVSVHTDAWRLSQNEIADSVISRIPVFTTILNRQRQIVYANPPLLDFLGAASAQAVLGQRPGEVFSCEHAFELACGCGTTEACRECGAVKAILESQQNQAAVESECRIKASGGRAYDLRVWTMPYTYAGRRYTLFTAMDIRHEKRRQALEQTFLHDVNNLLMPLVGSSECLEATYPNNKATKYIHNINVIAEELAAEVTSYRKLVLAEEGRLALNLVDSVESLALVDKLIQVAAVMWPRRTVLRAQASESFVIKTERAILFRVLYNMVKNAVEATAADQTISIDCRRDKAAVVFSVHNPGCMPRPVQLQVFQRSFSTKSAGRGLGTYSMKLFGEGGLGGKVWFATSEASGTSFAIALPLACEIVSPTQ